MDVKRKQKTEFVASKELTEQDADQSKSHYFIDSGKPAALRLKGEPFILNEALRLLKDPLFKEQGEKVVKKSPVQMVQNPLFEKK